MQLFGSGNGPGRQRGFTFGEVVATLGVLGVSLSLVVPSPSSVTESNLRASGINELVATLHAARSEASTRNQSVVICPSADGETCAPVAWEAGWIRFIDANGDFGMDPGNACWAFLRRRAACASRQWSLTRLSDTRLQGTSLPHRGQRGGDFSFCPSTPRRMPGTGRFRPGPSGAGGASCRRSGCRLFDGLNAGHGLTTSDRCLKATCPIRSSLSALRSAQHCC